MKFYFLKKQFEIPEYWEVLFPEKFTFATSQDKLPPKGSILIIRDSIDGLYYITKIKNKGKITTFDYRISCVETNEIKATLEDIVKILNLRPNRFENEGEISLITDKTEKVENLKKYLIKKNSILKNYFDDKHKHKNQNRLDVAVESRDAFLMALELFKVPSRYMNLTEEQMLDWEFNSMQEIIHKTPDGKHFLELNNRKLFIQKVHNTPIERCLGVDMIYHFYNEDRLIFVQYKCFNHKNEKFYKSKDKHMSVEVKKMSALAGVCSNSSVLSYDQLRACDCPFFIKLCSRDLPTHRDKPYGFYYTICSWQKFMEEKHVITFDDEPRISNDLFKSLIGSKLIGTRKAHLKKILKKLMGTVPDDRLMLIFSEKIDDKRQ